MGAYWAHKEEEAVKNYVRSNDIAIRHKLYTEIIHKALRKLIENIFYVYKFNKSLGDLENIEPDLLAFMYEKLDKVDPNKESKAFSMLGTTAKHWLMQRSNTINRQKRLHDKSDLCYTDDKSITSYKHRVEDKDSEEFMNYLITHLRKYTHVDEPKFSKDEKIIINMLLTILENSKSIESYNKRQVYVYIKEGTDLSSRKITRTLNKVKDIYAEVRIKYYNE